MMSEDVERRKTTFIVRKDLLERAEKLSSWTKSLIFHRDVLRKVLRCLRIVFRELDDSHAGGGIRTHASLTGHGLSRPAPYHSATPAQIY